MRVLTERAVLKCAHRGVVRVAPSQAWVRVEGAHVLVEDDPQGRDIDRCPNRGPHGIRKCGRTLKVRHGYSRFVRIDGRPICLDSVWGFTDGTPPGAVRYIVVEPGQELVAGAA